MTFIENLFFGNVDPQARAVKTGSRADKLRIFITDHLPEIENALPDEQRSVLEKIFDAQSELDTITELDSFIVGFRLGAAFSSCSISKVIRMMKCLAEQIPLGRGRWKNSPRRIWKAPMNLGNDLFKSRQNKK